SWVLQRNDANVQGSVNLAKLQLRQYLNPDKEWQLGDWRYPDWLQDNISLNVQVNLDDLELDGASVNNIRSTVQADAERVAIDPMSADVYNGKSAGSLHILNRQPMEWELNQSAQNIEVQPLLQDLFQYSRFSGKGNVDLSLRGQGLHYRDWLPNFSGSLQLDIQDGEWQGINFSQLAKKISGEPQLLANNETPKTPFSHFQLHTKIEQGVSKHQSQATLLRPAATVQGQGEYHFQQNQLDEDLLIVGEGSQTPLPLHIRGKLDEPEISLNYQQMTSGLKTPQEKQQAVSDTLKKQWQWLLQSNQKNKE
ncbi:AsmA family protein, partial [Kingella kingae]